MGNKAHLGQLEKAEERGEVVDIAGIDDTKHKDEYIRQFNPSFVTQRTIPEGRSDLFPLLREIGLTYNDLFEVMCRTHATCGNDDYYVSRTPDKVIDIYQQIVPYDIPDYDTSNDGWLFPVSSDESQYKYAKDMKNKGELTYKIPPQIVD